MNYMYRESFRQEARRHRDESRQERTGMPTLPPPPVPRLKQDLHSRAAELRRMGAQLLARANELDQIAERL